MPIDKPRIFLVDDDKDILEIFMKGLKHNGFEVDAFSNSIEAIQHFKAYRYDVLVTDIRMPGMNGIDLYRLIRKQDERIKVYFISSLDVDFKRIKEEFPNIKDDSFITKPLTLDRLAHLVQS